MPEVLYAYPGICTAGASAENLITAHMPFNVGENVNCMYRFNELIRTELKLSCLFQCLLGCAVSQMIGKLP